MSAFVEAQGPISDNSSNRSRDFDAHKAYPDIRHEKRR